MNNLIALCSFTGPDGSRNKGEVFQTTDDRAQFLIDGGYASVTDQPVTEIAALAETQAVTDSTEQFVQAHAD